MRAHETAQFRGIADTHLTDRQNKGEQRNLGHEPARHGAIQPEFMWSNQGQK